jgi:hypothetical protein
MNAKLLLSKASNIVLRYKVKKRLEQVKNLSPETIMAILGWNDKSKGWLKEESGR